MSFTLFHRHLSKAVRCCGGCDISLLTTVGNDPARKFNCAALVAGGKGVMGQKIRVALDKRVVHRGSFD